ncbi:hypothetical protein ACE193_05140 [Bernardetia sp. OM2101]|uniref:hypothetical protein n=1 Tax=Bernardetia sp. OM2101 TaxID=3344876 RepID=UPI0035D11C7C
MKSPLTTVVFFFLFMFPVLSFAQDEGVKIEVEIEESDKKSTRTDTKTNKKTNRKRVIIIEQDELDDLKEEIKIDLKELKIELKNAFKEIEDIDWEEVDHEIEIAMEEARQGLEEANEELAHIRIEIDEDFEEELHEELEELREELDEIHVNNGSPRIRILTQNSRPYKGNRKVERNFSELNTEANPTLSDKMKKQTTTLFDESVQNSVKITPQIKEGKFILNFSLSENKADKKTTYIEVYDSEDNAIYFESLVDFSGNYQGEIDLAVNGADTYTLVVRQGTNYLSRKINLK